MSLRVPGIVPQDISSPSLLASLKIPPEIDKLSRDRAIELTGYDREDLQAVNIGSLLKINGFQKVYFTPEGERGLLKEKVITPTEVQGVTIASVYQMLNIRAGHFFPGLLRNMAVCGSRAQLTLLANERKNRGEERRSVACTPQPTRTTCAQTCSWCGVIRQIVVDCISQRDLMNKPQR